MEKDFVGYISVRHALAPASIKRVASHYLKLCTWLSDNNLVLNKSSCEQFLLYSKSKYAPATTNLFIGLFKYLEEYYEDRGKPIELVKDYKYMKKEVAHIDILTLGEVEKLINKKISFKNNNSRFRELDQLYLDFTATLAYTGARFSEIQQLRVRNISPDGRILIEKSKGKSFRYVFVPPNMFKRLSRYIDGRSPDALLFATTHGKPFHAGDFLNNLKKRALLCGINKRVYPHLLRHTWATQALIDGLPIEMVATCLGHKEIGVTYSRYTHLADDKIKKSVYGHSLFKKSVAPSERIKALIELFKGLKFDEDERFGYKLDEGLNSVNLQLYVR